jgi:UDPglucose--hexose-1-phosphate uridylyltransferase
VAIAPARGRRPGVGAPKLDPPEPDEAEKCPFCEGHEDRTPPEVLALGREGGEPNTPGWTVRVVPNLYPALERQEVVVHSPKHIRSFAELDGKQLQAIAQAWQLRSEAAHRDGFGYVHAMINEGAAAGASLPHSHSQLVSLREPPPEVAREEANVEEGRCSLCRLLEEQREDGPLLIAERDGVTMLSAPAGRAPYELLIAGGHGEDPNLVAALELLAEGIRRLHRVEGLVPWNAWLHTRGHWHFEVVPRLTVFAGLELGAGIYVNPVAAELAAELLRS